MPASHRCDGDEAERHVSHGRAARTVGSLPQPGRRMTAKAAVSALNLVVLAQRLGEPRTRQNRGGSVFTGTDPPHRCGQAARTCAACGPFGPCWTTYSTFWFSSSVR